MNVTALQITLQYEALESGVIFQPVSLIFLIASCHFSNLKLRFCVIQVFVCAGRSLVV